MPVVREAGKIVVIKEERRRCDDVGQVCRVQGTSKAVGLKSTRLTSDDRGA